MSIDPQNNLSQSLLTETELLNQSNQSLPSTDCKTNQQKNLNYQIKKPNKGVDISFFNLNYSVKIKEKNKETGKNEIINKNILNNLRGICKAGEITAIMGASGAGKTTLLNVLCKRIDKSKNNELNGDISANQESYSYDQFSNFAAYIMQDDRLMETMTVYECLLFAARLKVKGTKEEQEEKVDQIIKQMKLQKSKDTLIGGEQLKGISGGERKRCSIGLELMADPSVIFLDEPTSGLDSFTAFMVINELRQMAREQNKTVIFTIHQPSSDLWNLFDRIFLLLEGQFVYQGQGGQTIYDYFSSIGFKFPALSNPADYLIQIISKNDQQNKKNFNTFFKNYQEKLAPLVSKEIANKNRSYVKKEIERPQMIEEIIQVRNRTLKHMIRHPIFIKSRIGQAIFVALFASSIFYQIKDGKEDPSNLHDINNYAGFFFFQTVAVFMESFSSVVLTFPAERSVFLKEENSKLYRIFPYFIGRTVLELPIIVICCILFSTIIFFMVGLRSSPEVYFLYLLCNLFVSFSGNSLGLVLGSSFSDVKIASAMMPIFLVPFMLFGGFYSNSDKLWVGIKWLEYFSPFMYGFDAQVNNNFQETYFRPNPANMLSLDLGYGLSIGILILLFIIYRVLAFLILLMSTKRLQ